MARANSTIERVRRDAASGAAATPHTDSQSREEMRAFLQKRVAGFGLMLALIFGMFMSWRLFNSILGDDSPSRAYLPWQALSVAAFLSIWLSCRGRARSIRFIRSAEFAGLCGAGAGAILMCSHVSYAARPDAVLLLCMTYTLIARAIMVPSTARRTLIYGVFFMLPFLVSVYFIHLTQHDPSIYNASADPRLRLSAETLARRWTVIAALWWTASTVITTSTSKVIYGLHQQVRDARRLGQYTLTEKLGQGGMGVVYRAQHAMLRRPSAIKLLPPDKYGVESVARFEREVQLTAGLSHPNTVRVYDYGRTPDGIFYYVMEYLDGASLEDVVKLSGPLPPARAIHILDQVAGALGEAHAIGLIHRDIKPANIFLTQQGGVPDVAKVLDFGLVKQVAQGTGEATTLQAVTHDDSFSGTPLYMAPEAITAPEAVDARTDLYSLGAVGYFLLTGSEVFGGRNVVEICSHHLHSTPVPPSQRAGRALAGDLETLIMRCLEKSQSQRPADARSFQAALRACKDARAWSEDDARRWFELHGVALNEAQGRMRVSGAPTIAVDLGKREPQRRAG
ncbi:MAG TPA: serine/threonine-protein kinase [Polyangiales bacterium]|nr:serine/threonine-protein kinase [Polyangiales bacterium]